ncbi:MAG: DUF427 domain-containing protein [Xanthomonadales bacterium]|nr:DUF427 domain-containing protein [Xanthomonadales bacterium]
MNAMWKHTGLNRPEFAITPQPGQESVWDYPRPPDIRADQRRVKVHAGNQVLAETTRAKRILETASPPTFYLPPEDVALECLVPASGVSFCEWKGTARYWAVEGSTTPVAWSYPDPTAAFSAIAAWLSFYPGRVACYVDGERVRPQPGGFYGGWLTAEIVGPVKGDPGSGGW